MWGGCGGGMLFRGWWLGCGSLLLEFLLHSCFIRWLWCVGWLVGVVLVVVWVLVVCFSVDYSVRGMMLSRMCLVWYCIVVRFVWSGGVWYYLDWLVCVDCWYRCMMFILSSYLGILLLDYLLCI